MPVPRAQVISRREAVLAAGGTHSIIDAVRASAAVRSCLKELEILKAELNEVHLAEEKKVTEKARSVRDFVHENRFARFYLREMTRFVVSRRHQEERRSSRRTSLSAMRS